MSFLSCLTPCCSYPLLKFLEETDRREFLKALYRMAKCEPGADFPANSDPNLKELAMLGIVDEITEQPDTRKGAVRSLRLRGYYPTLVLHWVDEAGCVRNAPYEPEISDPMLIRLVMRAGTIERWLAEKDTKRLLLAEEALKLVYTRYRGKELKCKNDWLEWPQFVATFDPSKPGALKAWPGQFHPYFHVAATRQWRHPFAHVKSTAQLKQLAQYLPPFINDLLAIITNIDEEDRKDKK